MPLANQLRNSVSAAAALFIIRADYPRVYRACYYRPRAPAKLANSALGANYRVALRDAAAIRRASFILFASNTQGIVEEGATITTPGRFRAELSLSVLRFVFREVLTTVQRCYCVPTSGNSFL